MNVQTLVERRSRKRHSHELQAISGTKNTSGSIVSPRGSEYPNSKVLGPQIHTLHGFLDFETLLYWVLGPLGSCLIQLCLRCPVRVLAPHLPEYESTLPRSQTQVRDVSNFFHRLKIA